jgi:6-phosphogluconate dehydrogenase
MWASRRSMKWRKSSTGRKAIWIMVPQGKPVDDTIAKLEPLLNPGDILIDGGNSNYKDSIAATRK